MNLYLVLALALGVSTPAVQPRTNRTVAVSRAPAAVCGPISVVRVVRQRLKPVAARRSPRIARLVNTGSATPRAPAFSC